MRGVRDADTGSAAYADVDPAETCRPRERAGDSGSPRVLTDIIVVSDIGLLTPDDEDHST